MRASPGAGFSPQLLSRNETAFEHEVRAVPVEGLSPHPNPLPEGEGTGHPNPLPQGEGTGQAPAFLPTRPRRVVLWDTRKLDVSKDFAGGFGIGQYCGDGSFRSRVIRHFYKRDRRPSSLLYAYLAAIFARLGYRVEYAEDNLPGDADLYVFNPSLLTLPLEREAIAALRKRQPRARVLVVGNARLGATRLFADLDVTVVKGEAEQLLWKLDEALNRPGAIVQLGTLEDLDRLPMPDWSPFGPESFRIGYDFTRFPTGLVQSSRGCTLKCDYCPYIVLENSTRVRSPEAVADEIAHGIRRWGFRSFKFRDPLFGLRRAAVFDLADRLGRLPRKIQFSIETRLDLLPAEVLRTLRRVGLTSITVGIETPDDGQLRRISVRRSARTASGSSSTSAAASAFAPWAASSSASPKTRRSRSSG